VVKHEDVVWWRKALSFTALGWAGTPGRLIIGPAAESCLAGLHLCSPCPDSTKALHTVLAGATGQGSDHLLLALFRDSVGSVAIASPVVPAFPRRKEALPLRIPPPA
jgi:hypothetical protein